jgi:4-amino-4-deoxy-L-arabinose transferase-like glycosyltransferase
MKRPGAILALAIILWVVLVVNGLVARPLLPVDETRYLGVAWEMWQRGDFLVPHINGIAYHHKPPLLFWLMQAGWAVFGVSETWGRLVAPLFALGSILLTARLGRLLWPEPRETGALAALILTGSALFGVFISLTFFDTLVTFFALLGWIGLVQAARAVEHDGSTRWGWTIYAVALGLGVLSKGPVQLLHVLPAALLAPLWIRARPAGFPRRWYGALTFAVVGGSAIALAWAVPAAIAGGEEFARKIFLGQSTGRMVESFQHARPFWWYVPLAFAMLFPWLWWVAVWRRGIMAGAIWSEQGTRFCLCILVPAFIIFSAISGKQPHYMLPLVAAACLIIARLLAQSDASNRRFDWLLPVLPIIALGAILLSAPLWADRFLAGRPGVTLRPTLMAELAAFGLLVILCGIAVARTRTVDFAVAMLAAVSIMLLASVNVVVLAMRASLDVRPVAAFLAQAERNGTPVALLGDYEGQFHFAGRLTRPIVEVNHTTALTWAAAHPDGLLITAPRTLPPDPTPAFVAPFRGRQTVIWHARDVTARGPALLNN